MNVSTHSTHTAVAYPGADTARKRVTIPPAACRTGSVTANPVTPLPATFDELLAAVTGTHWKQIQERLDWKQIENGLEALDPLLKARLESFPVSTPGGTAIR